MRQMSTRKPRTAASVLAHSLRPAVAALLALLLAACATTPKTPPVVERAQARWDAVISNRLEEAYTFYSPGYRSSASLIDFGVTMRTRRIQWTSATYRDHECDGDRCTVRFDIGFRVPKPVPGLDVYEGQDVAEDTWVRSNGQWWYVPNK